MTEVIVEFARSFIENDYITIIFISLLPIIELRGAIPIAFGMEMSALNSLLFAYIGSSFVIPFLLLLLRPILNACKKIKFFASLAQALEDMFAKKATKVIAKQEAKGHKINGEISTKYKLFGVLGFVAIPLPLTGVWTGSAIAVFLDIKFLPSLIVILLGNLCAGIIMTLLCLFFLNSIDVILTVFLSIVVIILVSYVISLFIKSRKISKA